MRSRDIDPMRLASLDFASLNSILLFIGQLRGKRLFPQILVGYQNA